MLVIDSDNNISINRGDRITIPIINNVGTFKFGDKLTLSIVDKKGYPTLVFQKTIVVTRETNKAYITLTNKETELGEIISKKKDYWYEIKYNNEDTLVGYDEDGAKKFTVYPEAPREGDD